MDTRELMGKEPCYFFPELLPYLRADLLPGLFELTAYTEKYFNSPDFFSGLTSRIEALRDDLTNALAGVHIGKTKAA